MKRIRTHVERRALEWNCTDGFKQETIQGLKAEFEKLHIDERQRIFDLAKRRAKKMFAGIGQSWMACVCLFVCLLACLLVCLFVCMFVCLFVCLFDACWYLAKLDGMCLFVCLIEFL